MHRDRRRDQKKPKQCIGNNFLLSVAQGVLICSRQGNRNFVQHPDVWGTNRHPSRLLFPRSVLENGMRLRVKLSMLKSQRGRRKKNGTSYSTCMHFLPNSLTFPHGAVVGISWPPRINFLGEKENSGRTVDAFCSSSVRSSCVPPLSWHPSMDLFIYWTAETKEGGYQLKHILPSFFLFGLFLSG